MAIVQNIDQLGRISRCRSTIRACRRAADFDRFDAVPGRSRDPGTGLQRRHPEVPETTTPSSGCCGTWVPDDDRRLSGHDPPSRRSPARDLTDQLVRLVRLGRPEPGRLRVDRAYFSGSIGVSTTLYLAAVLNPAVAIGVAPTCRASAPSVPARSPPTSCPSEPCCRAASLAPGLKSVPFVGDRDQGRLHYVVVGDAEDLGRLALVGSGGR